MGMGVIHSQQATLTEILNQNLGTSQCTGCVARLFSERDLGLGLGEAALAVLLRVRVVLLELHATQRLDHIVTVVGEVA